MIPAVWIQPSDSTRALILGTNKTAAPAGALPPYSLDGRERQVIANLNRPNNVGVEYGLLLSGIPVDIAVVTERNRQALHVYRSDPKSGALQEVGDIPVFSGEAGGAARPWESPFISARATARFLPWSGVSQDP